MSPIMEEILSDSNSILTSDEPLSPTLQPQRRLKARPTTQISFDAYSSSSSGSSIKSFNTTPNKVDTGADYLLGLISKSNSNSATSSERTKISPFHNVKIGKRRHSNIMLTKEASSEEEELAQQNTCIDSDVPLDNNGDDSIISRNEISVISDDKEYSGYRRKYGHEGRRPSIYNLVATSETLFYPKQCWKTDLYSIWGRVTYFKLHGCNSSYCFILC